MGIYTTKTNDVRGVVNFEKCVNFVFIAQVALAALTVKIG
jgi:hypothetical protein